MRFDSSFYYKLPIAVILASGLRLLIADADNLRKLAAAFILIGSITVAYGTLARWRTGNGYGEWYLKFTKWQQKYGSYSLIFGLVLLLVSLL